MFERLKEVDKVLFWLVMIPAILILVLGLILGAEEGAAFIGGISVAVALLVDYYLAGLFYFIGVDKGYSDKVYLWVAYLIPVAGYLLIAAMPDRGGKVQLANDDLPDL